MPRNKYVEPPYNPANPLAERTRYLIAQFDAQDKDWGFHDSGEGTTYAEWFADLLEEWLNQ